MRREDEMQKALAGLVGLRQRAADVKVHGNREYNPGWHTALDLDNLLTVSEAVTRSALQRKESRGGHFRDDFPDKDAQAAKVNLVLRKGKDGDMKVIEEPLPKMSDELAKVIEEMK